MQRKRLALHMKIRLSKGNFIFNNIHTCNMYKKEEIMSIYIKKNKFLFILTILTSVISSLGYVFMAVLLQQLLDIAMDKNGYIFYCLLCSVGIFSLSPIVTMQKSDL